MVHLALHLITLAGRGAVSVAAAQIWKGSLGAFLAKSNRALARRYYFGAVTQEIRLHCRTGARRLDLAAGFKRANPIINSV